MNAEIRQLFEPAWDGTCAYPPCHCAPVEDGYCSEFCQVCAEHPDVAEATGGTEVPCGCTHADCYWANVDHGEAHPAGRKTV